MEDEDNERTRWHCHTPALTSRMLWHCSWREAGGQETLGTLWLGASLAPGRPRLQLASALKGSWRERGEHNRMLSFYWKINENEWK